MKLEDIGFYTLCDNRAKNTSQSSNLQRCELILTNRCNFSCPYCRGIKEGEKGDMSKQEAFKIVNLWTLHNLKNIRFSGGEPTLWNNLESLISYSRKKGIDRIALSTNGSAKTDYYKRLIDAGVNDISISLDSCCALNGDKMAGVSNVWDKLTYNIKELSKITYVTVGVVLTSDNYKEINKIVSFASDLGVADIRVIPAAQISKKLKNLKLTKELKRKHPILNYRFDNIIKGKNVRGLMKSDNNKCPLVLDDMAVLNNKHYPCIIYLREQGNCISTCDSTIEEIRKQRYDWYTAHDCYKDSICKNNCLDVCVDYNNKVKELSNA